MDAGRVRARAIGDAGAAARFAALVVSAALLLLAAGTPRADAQTIVNTATVNGQGNWLTSLTTTGNDGIRPEGRHIRLSLLVEHPPGRIVTGLKIDQDWDSSDESASSPTSTAGLDVQQPNVAGGFNYSRVNYDFLTTTDALAPGAAGGVSATLHVRAVLDNGSVSDPVSSELSFQSAQAVIHAPQQPFLFAWSRPGAASFFGGTTPGSQVRFGAVGQDPDPDRCFFSIPPVCYPEALGGVEWRTRNQLTGAATDATRRCQGDYLRNDDDGRGVAADPVLSGRGTFAVEGTLLNEDLPPPYSNDLKCEGISAGVWWPLGSIDVNSSSIPPPVLGIGSRPVVGGDVTVSAELPEDPDVANGGRAQYAEWDLDGNPLNGVNGFDRTSLGPYQGFGEGVSFSQTVDTEGMTPGLKTVRVRVTDNGAMSGADDVRATSAVATIQYRVDSPPVISPVSNVHSAINAPVSIALDAEDADGDPITWSVTDGPDHGSGSLTDASGTSNNYDFLPDEGYAGTDNVTFEVADGWGGTSTRTVGMAFHPITSIDSASPEALTQETDASFEFSSDTPGAIFLCTLTGPGGQQFGPCTSPVVYSSLPDGDYRFRVVAVSGPTSDGNPPTHEWTIDTTAPETAIKSKPGPRIVKSSRRAKVRFSFRADEKASFECKLDKKSFAGCNSPVTYRVKPGRHTFSVKATDEVGNLGPAEQTSFRFKRKG
jgi:Bacterial Ig domain